MSFPLLYPLLFKSTEVHMPRKIIISLKSLERLGKEVKYLGDNSKILIVTDKSVKSAGAPEKAVNILKAEGFDPYLLDSAEPEPRIEVLEEMSHFAREGGFDIVVGIGGGSVMDTSKLLAASITNPGNLCDYIGPNLVKKRGVPTICVPTTAGTGSEVSQFAVFTFDNKKRTCGSPNIIPDVALVDPILTISMPPSTTAGSGMDALAHAVESLISTEANPLTDAFAFLAIKLVLTYLRRAYFKPNDIEARYNMSLAATIAGVPLCNAKMVIGHSISQTFGPAYKVPHGISNAITLPYVMKFYIPAACDKLAQIVFENDSDAVHLTSRETALKAVKAVKTLADDINIPASLKDFGIPQENLPKMAEDVLLNFPRPNSPIDMNKDGVLKILQWMYKGEI